MRRRKQPTGSEVIRATAARLERAQPAFAHGTTQPVADAGVPRADRAQLVAAQKVWGSGSQCGGADGSGNWGWLDFGQGNGESALGAMITSSYSGTLTLNPTAPPSYSMDGTPGNRANGNPVHNGMSTHMDKTVPFPVSSTVTGNGENAPSTEIGSLPVNPAGHDRTTPCLLSAQAAPLP